ncbi:MAG: hypothetical protein ACRDB2_00445 [Fusobacteriaceae bacterium]
MACRKTKEPTECSETMEEVYIKISEGKIKEYYPENLHVLHVDLTKERDWAYEC